MAKQLKTLVLMGFPGFLFSCNGKNDTENSKLEEITSRIAHEEDWKNIFLKITEETMTDTSHIYIAKGFYKEHVVGLQLEVSSEIGAGIVNGKPDGKSAFVSNAVQFRSIGQESDEFVKALAELYKQPAVKSFTSGLVSATVFSLNEKPVNLDKRDYYRLKLFFEDDEGLYSEVFLNINTDKREVEIQEKAEEYREPMIKVWTK